MSEAVTPRLTEHQRYWLNHIQACEVSGKRVTEYAATHGLGVRAMYDAKRALVKKGVLPGRQAPRLQRARVIDSENSNEWRIQLPNGVSVSFAGLVDGRTLGTVLRTAAAVE